MTTATVTPTATRHPVLTFLHVRYLRWRLSSCERDIAHCQHGAAALEAQENAYRDAARAIRTELRRLGAL